VQLGLENKKKTTWAVALAVVALLAVAYEFIPFFTEHRNRRRARRPRLLCHREKPRTGRRPGKKLRVENLDPTLRLDLLATSEKTQYEGSGRNIFVSQTEPVVIPHPHQLPERPSSGRSSVPSAYSCNRRLRFH